MNDYGFLWWVGGAAIIFGILGLIGLLALWVDHKYSQWQERHGRKTGTFKDGEDDK